MLDAYDILLMAIFSVMGYVWGRNDERAAHRRRMTRIIRQQRKGSY